MALPKLPASSIPARPIATTYVYNNSLPAWVAPVSKGNLDNSAKVSADKRQATFNAEGGVLPIVYGEQRVGSKVFAVSGTGGKLTLGVAFCEGPISSFTSVDINDIASTDPTYSGKITVQSFTGSQTTASGLLLSTIAGYNNTADALTGITYAAVQLNPESTSGFPTINAQIKGRLVYDPRDSTQTLGTPSTWKWSDNPALCLADLISSTSYGLGKSMDWTSVGAVANYNDKLIGSPAEKSRTLNIVIDTQQSTAEWIETLRAYAGCFIVPSSAGYKLIPDKPIGYGFACIGDVSTYCQVPYVSAHEMSKQMSIEVSVLPNQTATGTGTILAKGSDYKLDYIYPTGTASGTVSFTFTDTANGVQTLSLVNSITSLTTISISVMPNRDWVAAFNGTAVSTTSPGAGTVAIQQTTAQPVYIGKTSGGTPFAGTIDEIRLWNRGRTITEIQANCKKALLPGRDNSLKLHIPFNEGMASYTSTVSGTWIVTNTVADMTGNAAGISLTAPSTNPWVQNDGSYDFFNFDGTNVIKDSTKFKKKGVVNTPTVIEVSFTDTTIKPWRDNYARFDNSAGHDNKVRLSNISLPGITRYSQAIREAILRYNQLNADSSLNFSAFDETLNITYGTGIQFHHPIIEADGTFFFKPYIVTGLKQTGFGKWDIVATEYDPANYNESVASYSAYPDSNLPRVDAPTDPTSVVAVEALKQQQDGRWASKIKLTFAPPTYPYIRSFRVSLYDAVTGLKLEEKDIPNVLETDGGNQRVVYVSSPALDLTPGTGITTWSYNVTVKTISVIGAQSTGVTTGVTLYGKYLKPSPVDQASFSGFEAGGKIFLNWDPAVDLDIVKYMLRYGTTGQTWEQTSLIDSIDALAYVAQGLPAGTFRFHVRPIDSVGQSATASATVDVAISLDSSAFLVESKSLTAPTATSLATLSFRDGSVQYITDHGDGLGYGADNTADATGTFGDSLASTVFAIPHTSATSSWLSESWDIGEALSGNLTLNITYTDLSGTAVKEVHTSMDNTAWTTWSGNSARGQVRYARAKLYTTGSGTFTIIGYPSLRLDVTPREESGSVLTSASTYVLVTLSGQYSVVQSLQFTPFSGTAVSAVADRMLVSPEIGLMASADFTAAGSVTQTFSRTARTFVAGDTLEFDVYCSPKNKDATTNFGIVVKHSDATSTSYPVSPSFTNGGWVSQALAMTSGKTTDYWNLAFGYDTVSGTAGLSGLVRNVRITNGGSTVATIWTSAEPTTNSTLSSSGALDIKMGPSNSFLAYAFDDTGVKVVKTVSWLFKGI